MTNKRIVFDADADYGVKAGVEYELFDSQNGEMCPFYIVPKGDLKIWVNMENMLLDGTWEFTVLTGDAPYKTIKDKKTASKSIKNMLEEMKATKEAIRLLEGDLKQSEVNIDIDFEEFTVKSRYYQRHELL